MQTEAVPVAGSLSRRRETRRFGTVSAAFGAVAAAFAGTAEPVTVAVAASESVAASNARTETDEKQSFERMNKIC